MCEPCADASRRASDFRSKERSRGAAVARTRAWRIAHPGYQTEYNKKYWQATKAQQSEKNRRWREENAQHVREYLQKWRSENVEHRRVAMQHWRMQNPEATAAAKS